MHSILNVRARKDLFLAGGTASDDDQPTVSQEPEWFAHFRGTTSTTERATSAGDYSVISLISKFAWPRVPWRMASGLAVVVLHIVRQCVNGTRVEDTGRLNENSMGLGRPALRRIKFEQMLEPTCVPPPMNRHESVCEIVPGVNITSSALRSVEMDVFRQTPAVRRSPRFLSNRSRRTGRGE
jgi:hypothetical protein